MQRTDIKAESRLWATRKAAAISASLYGYMFYLGSLFKDVRDQIIFDMPGLAQLDLEPEIKLWRTKIGQWQRALIDPKYEPPSLRPDQCMQDVEDLIARGTLILAKLVELQSRLHPEQVGAKEANRMTVNVRLSEGAEAQVEDMEMPELESYVAESPSTAIVDQSSAPVEEAEEHPLGGFVEDDK